MDSISEVTDLGPPLEIYDEDGYGGRYKLLPGTIDPRRS